MNRNQLIITSLVAAGAALFGVFQLSNTNEFIIEPPTGWNYLEDPSVVRLNDGTIVIFGHGGRCCTLSDRERMFVWTLSRLGNRTSFIRPVEEDTHEIGFQSAVFVRGLLGIEMWHDFYVRTTVDTFGLQNRVRIGHGIAANVHSQWTWSDNAIPVLNDECQQPGTCNGIGQHHPIAFWDGTYFNVLFIEHAGGDPAYRLVKLSTSGEVVSSENLNLNCDGLGFCSVFTDGGMFNGSLVAVTTAAAPLTWGQSLFVYSWTGSSWRKLKQIDISHGFVKGCTFVRNTSGNVLDLNNFVCVFSETADEIPNNSIYWRWIVINTTGTPMITEQPDWSGMFAQPTPTPTPTPTPDSRRPRRGLIRMASIYPELSEVVWSSVGSPTTLYVWTTTSNAIIRVGSKNYLCTAWRDTNPCVLDIDGETDTITSVVGASAVVRTVKDTAIVVYPNYVYSPIACGKTELNICQLGFTMSSGYSGVVN